MIRLTISNHNSFLSENLQKIYESAFPNDERRDWSDLTSLFRNRKITFYTIHSETKEIGFLSTWNLGKFLFIEHFAIHENERNNGFGTFVINELLLNTKIPVLLETEENMDSVSAGRINFYLDSGFKINEFEYYQPPYKGNEKFIKMLILSFPAKINLEEFAEYKNLIYKEVYNRI